MICKKCNTHNKIGVSRCVVCNGFLYGYGDFLRKGTKTQYAGKNNDIDSLNRVLSPMGLSVTRFVDGLTMVQFRIAIGENDEKALLKLETKFKRALHTESVRTFIDYETDEVVIEKIGAQNTVRMGDLYNSKFVSAAGLPIMLGKDAQGNNLYTDLTKAPHMLVAGCTGSGKSIFLHSLICSVMMKNPHADIYGIDPKGSEFKRYAVLPSFHFVTESDEAVQLMKRLCDIMDDRYRMLTSNGYRDIDSAKEHGEKIERIVCVIDEFADLMENSKGEIEPYVVRLAQKARACGIHLVIATQYPIVKYVTGAIKANIPCRVALQVNSITESRVIMDKKGAEELLGKGDMFFIGKSGKPIRIQGCFVDEVEVESVVATTYDLEYYHTGKIKTCVKVA